MIKYRSQFGKIEPVEIFRETEKQVVLVSRNDATKEGRKEAKRTSWSNYHDTWEDAHKFLVDEASDDVDRKKRSLSSAEKELAKIQGMKK
jgi:hypothetical protein